MSEIRILIPIHVMPSTKNVVTIFIQNLTQYMNKISKVHLIWLVYMPEKTSVDRKQNAEESIIDFHDYKNAYELLKKEKPDLIYASPDWSFIDYALSSAAKFCQIPVFFMIPNVDRNFFHRKSLKSMILNSKRFFETSIPTDIDSNQKQLFRRGRFFLKKYIFLLKTQLILKNDLLLTLFGIWKYVMTGTTDARFAQNTIQFLENEYTKDYMIQRGFKDSNLIISGNPIYDLFFKTYSYKQSNSKTTRVLFSPSTAYEHGFWTKEQRDFTTKQIVKQISDSNLELLIKIHPSSSILSDYSDTVNEINKKIPIFQKGSIDEYLNNIDVVITSPFSSSAETYAILAHKRIVICDFFETNYEDQLVTLGLAKSCKNPSKLKDSIDDALQSKSYEEKRDEFIKNFLFKWDGNSSQRIVEKLVKILQKN